MKFFFAATHGYNSSSYTSLPPNNSTDPFAMSNVNAAIAALTNSNNVFQTGRGHYAPDRFVYVRDLSPNVVITT